MRNGIPYSSEFNGDEKPDIDPLKTSLAASAVFAIFSIIYIHISGVIVLELSEGTTLNLHRLESLKGTAYVTLTGILMFFMLYFLLEKIRKSYLIILENRRNLIKKEKQITAGIMSASIAHDINNLNQVIMGNLFMLEEKLDGSYRKETDKIAETCTKMATLTRKLFEAGKSSYTNSPETVDIGSVIRESVSFASGAGKARYCKITEECTEAVNASINSMLFGRVLINLIFNSAEAAGKNGAIIVSLYREKEAGADSAVIEVHDNGPGINPELKEKIFDPFFTTKESGSGLGLVSARVFAHEHGGHVSAGDSDKLGGACITMKIPLGKTND